VHFEHLFHSFKQQLDLPTNPIETQDVLGRPVGGRQGGNEQDPTGEHEAI
jgi:hypothetical protein